MIFRCKSLSICLLLSALILVSEPKSTDLYKVLGVERNASQREIQKAFHKLSLQYHPDKNKNKGAQEKFAEINNAYDVLSDEEKRKNYDMYGDEKGGPQFGGGAPGGNRGYHFTSGGPGSSHFTFDPNEWQTMGSQGNSEPFSFSFGNPGSSGSSFGFGMNDIFSNFFGGGMGGMGGGSNSFNGFGGSNKGRSQSSPPSSIQNVNSALYKKEMIDQGITWILLSYVPSSKGYHALESIVGEVGSQLNGALKVGSINCQKENSLCKEIGIAPSKSARIYVYSYKASDKGSLVEYNGDWDARNLKSFCQDHLPRHSKRVDISHFDITSSRNAENLPRVLLLSTKKDTPVIWRVLSGLYRKQVLFYDAEAHNVFDPAVQKLGVDAFPAIVGWLSNGEKHVLKTGVTVKDLKSGVRELSDILDRFVKLNKKTASKRPQQSESGDEQIPLLSSSNVESVCGESTPVCIIGTFASSKGREKMESVLNTVSKKSLTRRKNQISSSGDSISFSLLDANKQKDFLNSLDKSGFRSKGDFVVAYKPRKGRFAVLSMNELKEEEVERFVSGVLSGDVQFSNIKRKPILK